MDWQRTSNGTYVARGSRRPGDGDFTERSWHVWKLRDRRWVIESVRTEHQPGPRPQSVPPLRVTGTKHGTAYTLREAKELVARADVFLSYPTTTTTTTHEEARA